MEFPYLDTEKREYHVSDDVVLTLVPVSPMALMAIKANKAGKPVPPETESVYAGGKKVVEKNFADPNYLRALADWELDKQFNITKYLVSFGVKNDVPDEELKKYEDIFPDMSKSDIKYMWICSVIDVDHFNGLVDAILGQNTVTEKGLAETAESFPGDGESQAN